MSDLTTPEQALKILDASTQPAMLTQLRRLDLMLIQRALEILEESIIQLRELEKMQASMNTPEEAHE